mmetsp:Transcript_10899/g.34396  ORF Transcript_10899/g.34396 Transcript_10899/m.34396 type:complete len:317 (+) Transcript_10899:185-1135(+)
MPVRWHRRRHASHGGRGVPARGHRDDADRARRLPPVGAADRAADGHGDRRGDARASRVVRRGYSCVRRPARRARRPEDSRHAGCAARRAVLRVRRRHASRRRALVPVRGGVGGGSNGVRDPDRPLCRRHCAGDRLDTRRRPRRCVACTLCARPAASRRALLLAWLQLRHLRDRVHDFLRRGRRAWWPRLLPHAARLACRPRRHHRRRRALIAAIVARSARRLARGARRGGLVGHRHLDADGRGLDGRGACSQSRAPVRCLRRAAARKRLCDRLHPGGRGRTHAPRARGRDRRLRLAQLARRSGRKVGGARRVVRRL